MEFPLWYYEDCDDEDSLVKVTWCYSSHTQTSGFIKSEGREVCGALSGLGT